MASFWFALNDCMSVRRIRASPRARPAGFPLIPGTKPFPVTPPRCFGVDPNGPEAGLVRAITALLLLLFVAGRPGGTAVGSDRTSARAQRNYGSGHRGSSGSRAHLDRQGRGG